jgi:hypothetical protein
MSRNLTNGQARNIPSRILLVLLAIVLLKALPVCAAKLDGFVTKVNSPSSFTLGTVTVDTVTLTRCRRRNILRFLVLPSSSYRWKPITAYREPLIFLGKRVDAIPCDIQPAVGTRVQVNGTMEDSSRIRANQITIFSLTRSPKLSQNLSDGQSIDSDKARPPIPSSGNPNETHGTMVPKTLQLGYGDPIITIPSPEIQEYVSEIGNTLVESSASMHPGSPITHLQFRFYVVRSSEALIQRKFATVNGILPYNISSYGRNLYIYKKSTYYFSAVQNVIALPDGIILVPDTVLARLCNEAQLAALLADSIASIKQNKVLDTSLLVEGTGPYAMTNRFREALRINQQVLQLGMHIMYGSGYDIRELPFAWAVARGQPINNPVIDTWHADRKIPWYASYAFLYMSIHYQDVDFSKLKRGKNGYKRFLLELYSVDPGLEQRLSKQKSPTSIPQ